jgi:hypothetical protein
MINSIETNYNFFLEEENIEKLTKDRIQKSNEIFDSNDYYGQASVFKKYLKIPEFYKLKVTLEHGIEFSDDVWSSELQASVPVCAVLNEERAVLYKNKNIKTIIPIGFGFIYAIDIFNKLYGKKYNNSKKCGTVVFPSHSTHHIKSKFNFKKYSEYLDLLPDKFKPIIVCIYWKDYLNGHHIEFIKKGFKIVTAGHMYDKLFLFRLYNICRQFKYSTSNSIGSHVPISIKSGCSFFLSEDFELSHENPLNLELGTIPDYIKGFNDNLFSQSTVDSSSEIKLAYADKLLGLKFKKSRVELFIIILYAEFLDKFYFNFKEKGFRILPTFLRKDRIISSKIKKKILKIYKLIFK